MLVPVAGDVEHVPHFFLFGAHIIFVGGAAFDFKRHAFGDFEAVAFQPHDLARVVGHETQLADAEIKENLRPHAVVPQVGLEAQLFVGFHGVVALILSA